MVLTRFAAGGASLVWTWFATAWTYAILAVPILLLPTVLGRRDDRTLGRQLRRRDFGGACVIGFLRWVFVVPPLARCIKRATGQIGLRWRRHGSPSTSTVAPCSGSTLDSCWGSAGPSPSASSYRQSGAASLVGVVGLIVSVLYLFNQGDILATALPGFPVFDLAGLIGSTGWGHSGGRFARPHAPTPPAESALHLSSDRRSRRSWGWRCCGGH